LSLCYARIVQQRKIFFDVARIEAHHQTWQKISAGNVIMYNPSHPKWSSSNQYLQSVETCVNYSGLVHRPEGEKQNR